MSELTFEKKLLTCIDVYEDKDPSYRSRRARNPIRVCLSLYNDTPAEFKKEFENLYDHVLMRVCHLAPESIPLIWNDCNKAIETFIRNKNTEETWVKRLINRYTAQYNEDFTEAQIDFDYK
jgi:hypothetical protein